MAQHFLVSAAARTMSLKDIYSMGEEKAFEVFCKMRWPQTDGNATCPKCGCVDTYFLKTRRSFKCAACYAQFSATSGNQPESAWWRCARMPDYTIKLLGLSETIHRWHGALAALDAQRRERVADYAEEIAGTLARAAVAFAALEKEPANPRTEREAIRELGRIAGYVEDIVATLKHHLDGRKLAGVKRRLDQLAAREPMRAAVRGADAQRIERLLEAEGYFRALADGLRI